MVFVIDLTSADGLFSAAEFILQNKDIVMVAESPITSTQTVLGMVGALFSVVRTGQVIGEE